MRRLLTPVTLVLLVGLALAACDQAGQVPTDPFADMQPTFSSQPITEGGTFLFSGVIVHDPDEFALLRHVGDPAPDGHSADYQWGDPRVEVFPGEGPVVIEGTLDFTAMDAGTGGFIAVADLSMLEEGDGFGGYHASPMIYVFHRGSEIRIGPSDGNPGNNVDENGVLAPGPGGDFLGPRLNLDPDTETVEIKFTIDGTAVPGEDCPARWAEETWAHPATGCLFLEVDEVDVGSTSYGEVRRSAHDQGLENGGIIGWDNAIWETSSHLAFDLAVSPADTFRTLPTDFEHCMDGGWEDFGFRNQGQCLRFVNTGQDSR